MTGSVVVACLNPAWDVTYEADALVVDETNRVGTVRERLGGKGVNVARVLRRLATPVRLLLPRVATGPEAHGWSVVVAELTADGVEVVPWGELPRLRRTTAVVTPTSTTLLNEPGQPLTQPAWDLARNALVDVLGDAGLLVLSGSLPPGAPLDAYGQLVLAAHERRVRAVVDTSGPSLRAALAARPALVKPNREELRAATGLDDPLQAAQALADGGAEAVVASLGADGMLAVTPQGSWRAGLAAALSGNATGAGDAAVAALAAGLVRGAAWPELLREAVAWSAAAVARPVAGEVDAAVHGSLVPDVAISRLPEPSTLARG